MINHPTGNKSKHLISHHLSIRQRLPLLICVLLLSTILVFGSISYLGIRKASLKIGEDRLKTLTGQLNTTFTASAQSLVASAFVTANKSAIKKYLQSGDQDTVTEELKILDGLRIDSTYPLVELFNADKVSLLRSEKKRTELPINIDSILSQNLPAGLDSGTVGRFYSIRDSVYYPIIATAVDNNKVIGYLVRWKIIVTNTNAVQQLSQLLGTDAKLYFGNDDGSLWTDMINPVKFPKTEAQQINAVMEYTRENTPVMGLIQRIPNSNWLLLIELSRERMLDAANQFLRWLFLAAALILIIGISITWLISRNITRPLENLTIAAAEIASGNYSGAISNTRHDELGKLAEAFNRMKIKISEAQEKLRVKAENYKLLFENNPMPMWIMSDSSHRIIDVNKAALDHYGYSKNEFLQLSTGDIWVKDHKEKNKGQVKISDDHKIAGVYEHKKKNGSNITVDIIADDIIYEGEKARIILANDITEKLKIEAELVQHRLLQQEIIAETAIHAQEKERDELGRELHDNINQILASSKLYLEMARNSDTNLSMKALTKGYENVNLAIKEIRHLSKHLVPPALEDRLINILREMTDEIRTATNIDFVFNSGSFDEQRLNEEIKLIVYRIVQEQVNNIVKYAKASQVNIYIANDAHEISLLIADNGVGFDTTQKSKGIGLRNIENRVKFYKGSVSIHSQKGNGCVLEVSIPMKKAVAFLR